MKLPLTLIALALTTPSASTAQRDLPRTNRSPITSGAGRRMPAFPDLEATLAGPAEPGERLVDTGTVSQPDGRTPAEGVLLYAYHTNAEGVYAGAGTRRVTAAATATCGGGCGRRPRAGIGSIRSNRAATPAGPSRPTSCSRAIRS
ncbi:MAG: hypothetical protein H0W36_05765 [Gemmatimonadetes bacterium]|nr:hypothetical protein [Gemmatimonadota bacterium]